MVRSFTYSALTLRLKPSGESNREAWFLTAEEGLLRATVFGGPKSRLRSLVSPFHSGKLMIYHDPVRDSRKVSDFDVTSWRPGIRELYERAMTSDAVAETILASHGGGGLWQAAFAIADSVFEALDNADAAACSRYLVYFLWRWAGILGEKPEIAFCSSCAREVKRDEVLWYSAHRETLFCENCLRENETELPATGDSGSLIRLGAGARLWLAKIESLSAPDLARVSPDAPSLQQAMAFTKAVIAGAIGRWLPTWDGV
ncbi:MAG: recombination protein O N-terminal domain-containing protein [Treponema sp.]|nr:recombination protein O N-terminal domain-containing protein [Treponema sp.]